MTEETPIFQQSEEQDSLTDGIKDNATETPIMEDLDLSFAEKFSKLGGKFIYCENSIQLFQMLDSLKAEHKWNYIFAWTHALRELMIRHEFQEGEIGFLIDNSDAAISFCDSLIADSGSIMLSPDQATNRRLTNFPEHHIIIANKKSFVPDLESGIERFNKNYYNRLPSIIELDDDKPVYKANHARILNAEGTKNVYVFYIDTLDFE